jgi:hypothetical protein
MRKVQGELKEVKTKKPGYKVTRLSAFYPHLGVSQVELK